jgi:NADPH:quinone reductase
MQGEGALEFSIDRFDEVIRAAVIRTEASVSRARATGCDAVLVWDADDLAAIRALTDGRRAEVVYDPIGRAKPPAARHVCVTWRGIGAPPAIEVETLFLAPPSLAAYTADGVEYV